MIARRARLRAGGDRGLVATELAVVFPVLLGLAMVAVFASRVSHQNAAVQSAADSAARAASIELDEPAALAAAQSMAAAQAELCTELTVDSLTWPEVAPGRPGVVTVALSCTVDNSSLGIGFGRRTITATAVATVEYWRPAS